MTAPDVSVIIATYNRSAVLRHALRSLQRQTFTRWEALIVGDGCTDDTEAVVQTFDDPRFRFVNLLTNHGEQSVPNNAGVDMARGRFLAFLNHDDLWRTDHLDLSLAHLDRTGADLVYAWIANLKPDGTVVLLGPSPGGRYSPLVVVPVSTWVLRRNAFDRVGPWRNGWSIRLSPSQDWIWRAQRKGLDLREIPRIGVVGLPSGSRTNSYATVDDSEHAAWATRVASDPSWPEQLLSRYVSAQCNGGRLPPARPAVARLSLAARDAAAAAITYVGGHPLAVHLAIRHPGRGGFLKSLRRLRGLGDGRPS